jgi:hypothetical protein
LLQNIDQPIVHQSTGNYLFRNVELIILFKSFLSPSDEYLLTATRKLTIDELHQHAQDARSLYHEFWVCFC